MVNCLSNNIAWITFKYNNLPHLYCTSCFRLVFRLGHVRNKCNPLTRDEMHQAMNKEMQASVDERSLQLQIWPHEMGKTPVATTETGSSSKTRPEMIQVGPKLVYNGPNLESDPLTGMDLGFDLQLAKPNMTANPTPNPHMAL
ncbi:hypothetical protein FRX31_020423 [Thalictrum thalictroides]|uniref:Uncharacterized protein n=1 Tax=Thalictrum thalictroides TaxID=46969 RepID=A0A7J6W0H7_THATH|nr:hypothetical protein FRX31_020423 [Thalictrum thalictroides]